jgi:hypothetical protein
MAVKQAFVVTTEQGGKWVRWEQRKVRSIHTVVFDDGSVWDCTIGWRPDTKSAEQMADIEQNLRAATTLPPGGWTKDVMHPEVQSPRQPERVPLSAQELHNIWRAISGTARGG